MKTFYKISLILYVVIGFFGCSEHIVKAIEFTNTSQETVLSVGETFAIDAKMLPIDAQIYNQMIWSSSDNSVAQVNSRGVVTAVYSGSCIISASVGKVRAECKIIVKPINLKDLNFAKAVAYFYGDAYNTGLNNCELMFFSDGYNLQPDGAVSGAGYFFNIELNYPYNDSLPSNGNYTQNKEPVVLSFLPGYFVEEKYNTYIGGTYFGLSSLGGTGVILIKEGSLKIENNVFDGYFTGERNETVKINYSGNIALIDKTLPPPDTLDFDLKNAEFSMQNLGDLYGYDLNVFRVKFSVAAKELRIEFITPLSAGNLPTGQYQLNNSHAAFSLAEPDLANSRGTVFIENSQQKAFLYGNAKIEQAGSMCKLSIYLVDEDRRVAVGEILF
ncbi:MAG: Ig-like domain-containing protein [Prevotellaceae bacterium]|jgi:hypothetical protein|nr:Ig-like domain-containing protein [Prevotellaceae bacterium]